MTLLTLEVLRCTEGTYNSPSMVSTVALTSSAFSAHTDNGLRRIYPRSVPIRIT